ncbi:FecR domain-containing protein [Pseudoalteromonas sp. THAF3]|uniref:FecR family protein n=1 Tax=Pseudoalteromonas sp. THAF3 TaxID=2587843 RepID=UPI0020A67167|nr:FecR domain-containing protein [Pseudoalteromonas sp. THAF3]
MSRKDIDMTLPGDDETVIEQQATQWLLTLHEQQLDHDNDSQYPEALTLWLAQSARHRETFTKVSKLWALSAQLDPAFVDSQLAHLNAEPATKRKPKKPAALWYAALAASFLLVSTLMLWPPSSPAPRQLVNSPAIPSSKVYSEFFHTRVSEHKTVTLDDNSQVTLGANTQLAVRYSDGTRELLLYQGEALFNVSKDPTRPFIVRYQQSQVEALGTIFNVRANPDSVRVDVLEGRVAVAQQNAIELTAGQAAEVATDGNITRSQAQGKGTQMAWQQGHLIYHNARLGDVLHDVARYSQMDITINDEKLKHLVYTGTFLTTEIEAWLTSLQQLYPVKVLRSGDKVTLVAN